MKKRHYISAALLSMVAGGASAPEIMQQFQKETEGIRYTAYQDGAGIWTICGGVTVVDGQPVYQGQQLLPEKCRQVDKTAQSAALEWVDRNVSIPLTETQKVGIASFCPWNIGPEKCFGSTFFKLLNEGDLKAACEQIPRWVHDGGRDCRKRNSGCFGQVIRREQERELCAGVTDDGSD